MQAAKGQHEEAECRSRLGKMYNAVRRWNEAEAQYREALELRRRQFNGSAVADVDTTQDLAESLNELAWFYAEQAFDLHEGLRLADEAISLVEHDNDLDRQSEFLDTPGMAGVPAGPP